jgi:superoxide reductase
LADGKAPQKRKNCRSCIGIQTVAHLPVWKKDGCSTKITVGSVPHPMTEEHHIEWIEVISPCGCRVCRKYLKHDAPAEAEFCMELKPGSIVREYCNLHGLWVAEVQ